MKNPKTKERGQAIVELSMSLVMMLSLLAGIVDFGRAFFTWITLRDAAQEGASYASVIRTEYLQDNDNDIGDFCEAIRNRVRITTTDKSGGVSSNPINLEALYDANEISVVIALNSDICPPDIDTPKSANLTPADICHGNEVMVEVTYDSFPVTMPFLGTILGSQQIPLRASVRDTILTPACIYDDEE